MSSDADGGKLALQNDCTGDRSFSLRALLVAGEMFSRGRRHREEQESLERERQDLAARLAALESQYPQALVMMDTRGLIRRVNGGAESLFGYDESELLGHSILRLLPFAPSALNSGAGTHHHRGWPRRRRDGSPLQGSLYRSKCV